MAEMIKKMTLWRVSMISLGEREVLSPNAMIEQ
jgi:hypothetical protein